MGHRLGQVVELMEFVRATAGSADAFFIAGDLNLESYTNTLHLLKRGLDLKDAWLDQVSPFGSENKQKLGLGSF